MIVFRAYIQPLIMVTSFRYLGRTLVTTGNDCMTVVGNLWKARRTWAQLSWVLWREGAYVWTSGYLYLAVVHDILIFVSETWVMNGVSTTGSHVISRRTNLGSDMMEYVSAPAGGGDVGVGVGGTKNIYFQKAEGGGPVHSY